MTMEDRAKAHDDSSLEKAVAARRSAPRWRWITVGLVALLYLAFNSAPVLHTCRHLHLHRRPAIPQCPTHPEAIAPNRTWAPHEDDAEIELFAQRLSDAVKIPTMSFDDMDMDPRKDARFEIFNEMHAYLAKTYPVLHERFAPQKINTYGLLWTIPGRDENLRPALYLAHQDVVPVPASTLDQWTFPPFSGEYERYDDRRGGLVWGRGASDDKAMLTAVLSAFEELLKSGWENQRTVLIGSGFDEEVSGPRGALSIAEALKASLPDRGRQTLEFVIDEGGLGVGVQQGGVEVALPAVAEKGYLDVTMAIKTPGGHSSMPPDHTSIGMMSSLIAHLESNPHEAMLTPANPVLTHLICMANALETKAAQTVESENLLLDKQTRKDLRDPRKWHRVARRVAKLGSRTERYIVKTSQAADIVLGGVKANALPEHVEAVVNHRIAMESSVDEIKSRFEALVTPLAERFGLKVVGFDKKAPDVKPGESVLMLSYGRYTEHTPVSPTDSAQFRALAGTIRQVFTTKSGKHDRLVSPVIMTGNTDSRHFLSLCENVYRFNPNRYSEQSAKHTVNENMDAAAVAESASFFHALAQITDEKL